MSSLYVGSLRSGFTVSERAEEFRMSDWGGISRFQNAVQCVRTYVRRMTP